jgi:hypothetical protein
VLEQVRRCVDSLPSEERSAIDPDLFLAIDVSRGAIDGCCCLIFDRAGGAPRVVAKATRSPARKAIWRRELDNLRALESAGLAAAGRATPLALGALEQDGVLVTVQSALPGRLMRNVPGRELFAPGRAGQTADRVVAWLDRLRTGIGVHRVRIDEGLYEREVLGLVDRVVGRYLVGPEERRWLLDRFARERRLLGLDLPLTPAHGDFCTANLVVHEEGIGAFDWEHPLVPALPLYDLFFFFSSTRFPFRGLRQESSYAESLVEAYWGASYLSAELRRSVARACEAQAIPREAAGDLFVLALLLRADRKYDAFALGAGLADASPPAPDDEGAKRALWERLAALERDAPLFWCRGGVLESLRHITRHGLPRG